MEVFIKIKKFPAYSQKSDTIEVCVVKEGVKK